MGGDQRSIRQGDIREKALIAPQERRVDDVGDEHVLFGLSSLPLEQHVTATIDWIVQYLEARI